MADYHVTVCSACLCASCWHGEFMCSKAVGAGTTTRLRPELDRLNREHPSHYDREKLRRVTGRYPTEATDHA